MTTQDIAILDIVGVLAFLLVLVPLVWAAIQDGRYNSRHQVI